MTVGGPSAPQAVARAVRDDGKILGSCESERFEVTVGTEAMGTTPQPVTTSCDQMVREQPPISAVDAFDGSSIRGSETCRFHSRPCLEEHDMTATYTFDVLSSLDGYGGISGGDWGGCWGKQGPRVARPPPCLVRDGAADGSRRQHLSGVRADAGLEHRGVRSA